MKYLEIVREKRAQLAEQRAALMAELEAIPEIAMAESRDLNDDEATLADEVRSKIVAFDADDDALAAKETELAQIAERQVAAARTPAFVPPPDKVEVSDVRSMRGGELRDAALRVLDDETATRHLEADQKAKVETLIRRRVTRSDVNCDGEVIARRLLVSESDAYRSGFVKAVCQTHPIFTAEEGRAIEEMRAMNIGTDAAGGFGVPVLIDPTIVLTAQGSPNDIINLARVETITNDEWKGVSSAGVSWSFDAEAAAVSDDSPTLAQPNVPAFMARGFIPYSIEVGMDYPGFAEQMSILLTEGYLELVAEKLTTGTGSGQPTGIVVALDANTNVEGTPTTDGAFGAVDLYKLWDALPIKYRRRASVAWMSSTDVQNEARNFGATMGSNFTVSLTEDSIPRLFGRPYHVNDFMDDFTATTGAANLLIVGDWSNFLVAQRAGMSVENVPHLFDVTNNRPTGQRGWFAHARIGSDSINDLGFRILQNQ